MRLSAWFAILALPLLCSIARADTLVTTTGQTLTGPIHLAGATLEIATPSGQPRPIPLANVDSLTIDPPARAPATRPASAPANQGLLGVYYTDKTLAEPLFRRLDPVLDFDWSIATPHPSIRERFGVVWTGRLLALSSEPTKLIATSDDGVRLYLDGKRIIDQWRDQSGADCIAEVPLVQGRTYALKIEYYNGSGPGRFSLSWSTATRPRERVPADCLIPPAPPATAPGAVSLIYPVSATDGAGPLLRTVQSSPNGLRAEFFRDKELTEPKFTLRLPNIDILPGEQPLHPLIGRAFAIRYTGTLTPKYSETYSIHCNVDDGLRLWIDDRLLVDKWFFMTTETTVRLDLQAAKPVEFRAEIFQSNPARQVKISWSSPSQPRQVIPQDAFTPADAEQPAPLVAMAPLPAAARVAPQSLEIQALVAGPVASVRFYDGATLLGESRSAPHTLHWPSPTPGQHRLSAIATTPANLSAISDVLPVTIAGNGGGTLPDGWTEQTLGAASEYPDGTASFHNGQFHIQTAGGRLLQWGDDHFHFIRKTLAGDGQIIARVVGFAPEIAGFTAYAGITIRDSMLPGARHVTLLATPDNAIYVHRTYPNAGAATIDKEAPRPTWMRLLRFGDLFRAYVSADGKDWRLVASERIDMPPHAIVGLVAFTRDETQSATASFDHVAVTTGAPAVASTARGILTRSGSFFAADDIHLESDILRFRFAGQAHRLPIRDVARIAYQPLLQETLANLPPHSRGMLLADGDFVAGELRELNPWSVTLSSVLFGRKRVGPDQLAAVLLDDANAPAAEFAVGLDDGSVIHATQINLASDHLELRDAALGPLSIPSAHLRALRRLH